MPEPWSRLRWIVPLLGVFLIAGVIYDGTIFYSRSRAARQAKEQQADSETLHAQKVIDALGGDGLRIVSFYTARGELCYGVTGAKTVRIEPPVGEVWPALSRCIGIAPKKTTEYKLIAEDGAGHSAMESIPVTVH